MKMSILPLVIAALSVVSVGPVLAQDDAADPEKKQHPGRMGGPHNMPSFTDFDLDGDGAISSDEFYKFRAERIAKHAEEGRKMMNMANAPSFEDIDTDGDGGISPDEFSAHQAEHMRRGQTPDTLKPVN